MTYKQAKLKLAAELVLMLPFVILGKVAGRLFPLRTSHHLFLFFPNGDIGGSPKVNIDITQCVQDGRPLIIFSKKPKNNQFIEKFNLPGVRIINLAPYIDNKFFHFLNFFFRGIVAAWINNSSCPVLFGGECLFFYKMLPHVKNEAKCIELSHLPTWLSYNIAFLDRIDFRIFSTLKLKEQAIQQYDNNAIKQAMYERLLFVDNAIDMPSAAVTENAQLEVVFVGRGAPQKRVHLITDIARIMYTAGDRVHFSFVGDVEKVINPVDFPFCKFYGNVNDELLMDAIYRRSDVLILTSAFEGLPMVVMTMMAYGKIVLSTAVNGIPDYIEHMKNGLLIWETEEKKIILKGVELLRTILQNPELKRVLGERNRQTAAIKFSREVFCNTYRQLLMGR